LCAFEPFLDTNFHTRPCQLYLGDILVPVTATADIIIVRKKKTTQAVRQVKARESLQPNEALNCTATNAV
jgi:hypothetical protein